MVGMKDTESKVKTSGHSTDRPEAGEENPSQADNAKQAEPSETGFVNELINPKFSELGYIQVYTGDGKGKTTASLGLTFRALGRGWNVLVILFTKGGNDASRT